MLALTDDEYAAVSTAAAPIHPLQRGVTGNLAVAADLAGDGPSVLIDTDPHKAVCRRGGMRERPIALRSRRRRWPGSGTS